MTFLPCNNGRFWSSLLLAISLLLDTTLIRGGDAVEKTQHNGKHPKGGEAPDYQVGFEKLSDVKSFEPVKADGNKIEIEEFGAQFSFIIAARDEQCFFQPAKLGSLLNVQFQVESGGENDIDLIVYDPTGQVMMQEIRSSGNIYHNSDHDDGDHEGSSLKITKHGDYRICLSNRFSTMTSKRVYLDVGPVLNLKYKTARDDLPDQEIDSMSESMDSIQGDLDTVISMQVLLKRKHRKHMELALSNNARITWRSAITVILIFSSLCLQTYFIQLLFRSPSAKA